MANKLPKFIDKYKICIICEGNEEYEYLKRLKELKVWNENYVDMCRRVNMLDSDDSVGGSSNFGKFIHNFENNDYWWMDDINGYFE